MTFLLGSAPMPLQDPISRPKRTGLFGPKQDDPLEGTCSDPWVDWLSRLASQAGLAPTRIGQVSLVNQAASIAATDLSGGNLSAGLYKVSWYARITTAAGISSSLTVTIDWTDGGVAQQFSGAAMTGNTTATNQGENQLLIHIDTLSPVRYSTVRASAGVPTMQYRLDVILEAVQA